MTDVAGIIACYRAGQIDEAEMVEICREYPEVETALRESSITVPAALVPVEAGGCAPPIYVRERQA